MSLVLARRRWVRIGAGVAVLTFAILAISRPYFYLMDVPRVRARHPLTALREYMRAYRNPAPRDSVPASALDSIAATVDAEVRRGAFPGATLAVGIGDRVLLETGIGRVGWAKTDAPANADATLYDLASMTKILGTTAAIMALVDDGKLRLDDPVSRYLPGFTGEGRDSVRVWHLLTHTSGLAAGALVNGPTAGDRLQYFIENARIYDKPGTKVVYSDGGFILLGMVARRAAGESMRSYLQRRIYGPLGMTSARWEPGLDCTACAPTLSLNDGTPFRGRTNDPLAREFGGVTGNAGLFMSAHDVGRFAAMITNGGTLDGVRVLKPETVRRFTAPPSGTTGTRGLGWEFFCREGTVPDAKGCEDAYAMGHTGYTGTSLWIEPKRGIWVVLLTNRTYLPRAENRLRLIRRRIFNRAIGYTPPAVKPAPKPEPEDTADAP